MERHSGVLVSTVASQQKGSIPVSGEEPFFVEFACVGFFWVSRFPPTVEKHAC